MHVNKGYVTALWCLLLLLGTGCASTSAPRGYLPDVNEAQQDANGAWIVVRVTEGGFAGGGTTAGGATHVGGYGELIAVAQDTIFVLAEDRLLALPRTRIAAASLTAYDSDAGLFGLWTALGTLSTVSHGYVLSLSAPVWLIFGTISSVSESYAPRERYPGKTWEELGKHARFPQGMPPSMDRQALKPKWQ
jgi:hypothetical protein